MNARILGARMEDPGHLYAIEQAVNHLKSGQMVAFPTETVYGLGANALDADAVARIFEAKGRPASNPLIVHVADIDQARSLAGEWPAEAETLANAFWPGPLTIVLPKVTSVPDIVTAGGGTVALRCPDHPVALALLRACGFPLAAPSANRSNYISPTSAAHVMKTLGNRIPLILDGGACAAGVESTVLSLAESPARILRPGPITAELINRFGIRAVAYHENASGVNDHALTSPGQLPIHYAPNTPLTLARRDDVMPQAMQLHGEGKRVAVMQIMAESPVALEDKSTLPIQPFATVAGCTVAPMPGKAADYARLLYATLHLLDALELDAIICEQPPDSPMWAGVLDRLNRAASQ